MLVHEPPFAVELELDLDLIQFEEARLMLRPQRALADSGVSDEAKWA